MLDVCCSGTSDVRSAARHDRRWPMRTSSCASTVERSSRTGRRGAWERIAERHADGIRSFAKPTRAEARMMELTTELAAVSAPEHREAWRLLSEEQYLIMQVVHPGILPPLPKDPSARPKYLRDAVAMSEIVTFDPNVRDRMNAYGSASMGIGKGDPVVVATAILERAIAYYGAILAHPDMPLGLLPEGAEHHGREMVRQAISGYASLLGASAIERIRVEVLGDRVASDCPRCGGPLASPWLSTCRHCSAVIGVDEGDSWTKAQLGIWEISKKDLLRRGELDGMAPVIHAVGAFLHTSARDVPVERAFAFLQQTIPWVSNADFAQGLSLLAHGASPDRVALLNGLAAMPWTADPSKRPAAHVARVDFPVPTAEEEAAWVAYALGVWKLGGGPLLQLLGHPLSTLQVAAVHETESSVTARAAMAFFEQAMARLRLCGDARRRFASCNRATTIRAWPCFSASSCRFSVALAEREVDVVDFHLPGRTGLVAPPPMGDQSEIPQRTATVFGSVARGVSLSLSASSVFASARRM